MPLDELSSHLGSILAVATADNLGNAPVTELKTHLGTIDYTILIVYLVFVLGIGWALKRFMRSSSDFLTSGRSIPAWITGLAFISTNLGALEVMGMAASGAQYGILTCHFYWLGAIPAMVFLGLFMMPFYYGSRARSVPEYLNLRFDEKTRGFNAFAFAIMTIFASGASMYAMALLMETMLGWNFNFSILMSAIIVLIYTYLGGLTSAIYNEVLQFFLIVAGFVPLVFLCLKDVGGWVGMKERLHTVAANHGFPVDTWYRAWTYTGKVTENPMGVDWIGLVMGLGFVLSFGYWCTNFLVVQRAMAADSMSAARRTPLIGAIPKMFIPILVILPGMIAIALNTQAGLSGDFHLPLDTNGDINYNQTIPYMLVHYLPEGVLGLGITALIASFMSGMAGNVTAFNTVWTYDIYQGYIAPNKSDNHYLWMGRMSTIGGTALSMGAAYVAAQFNNIMNFLQLIFSFVNAPLFATLALGMFWRRSNAKGAFIGLVSGTGVALIHFGLTAPTGATTMWKGAWLGMKLHEYPSEMALNFWTAIIAFTVCFVVTIVVSLATGRDKNDEDLKGLVYSLTPHVARDESLSWYERPWILAAFVLAVSIALNYIFW
ncbi:MAG: sodium:solute symporter family protein [Thermoguttaceae bacterium]|jgi:SSS family solute:Na+ symporter